ncbi:MAG TPA: hypothetical protein VFC15_00130 [Candidatus Limnocylindrales bacterium]|jgi:hypothetical protein|nr:hypothetical protein [Candidatus Limnocylindrales bacterium]HZM08601.1 hypothetical protein [Candidatus Limnocylindrales bacterium]
MGNPGQHRTRFFGPSRRAATTALGFAIVFVLSVVATQAAQAQTFKVLHTFTGVADGDTPAAGLTMDRAGDLYGTTQNGGDGRLMYRKIKISCSA